MPIQSQGSQGGGLTSWRRLSTAYMATARLGWQPTAMKYSASTAQMRLHTKRMRVMLTCAASTIFVREKTLRGWGGVEAASGHASFRGGR